MPGVCITAQMEVESGIASYISIHVRICSLNSKADTQKKILNLKNKITNNNLH